MEVSDMRRSPWLLALVLLSSIECSHLDIHKTDKSDEQGLRFYRPRPYLLVTIGDKGCTPTIEYLPDYSQEYILHPHYWLGSLTFKPTLTNGWNLTAFDSAVDTKIPETINALAGTMKSAADLAKRGGQTPGEPTNFGPGLYSMTFDKQSGLLTKIEAIFLFTDKEGKPIACPQPTTK
jgi:hypothetical protein